MRPRTTIAVYDCISRERVLSDEESRCVEKAVQRLSEGGVYRKWTMDDKRELAKAARERGGLKAYAERTGRSYASCQTMLTDIKRDKRRRGVAFVGRFYYDGEIES